MSWWEYKGLKDQKEKLAEMAKERSEKDNQLTDPSKEHTLPENHPKDS
ncbi:MAG TPA: hypothetical protein VHE12_13825 [bacterium]|nr:hypothetical protein [bacterium]